MFKKGQQVKKISSWGTEGAWYVQDAIVTACGKKQMTLVDAHTGKPMGSTYHPTEQQRTYGRGGVHGLVKDCSMDEAKAIALELAAQQIAAAKIVVAEWLAKSEERGDRWYIDRAKEELATLEAATPSVATPYEPGHQYGPKEGEVIEQHKPRQKGTTYLARYEGQIVGKRVSHNPYTHAVVIKKADGTIIAPSFSRSLANAQKLQPYNGTVIAIVPVEVK